MSKEMEVDYFMKAFDSKANQQLEFSSLSEYKQKAILATQIRDMKKKRKEAKDKFNREMDKLIERRPIKRPDLDPDPELNENAINNEYMDYQIKNVIEQRKKDRVLNDFFKEQQSLLADQAKSNQPELYFLSLPQTDHPPPALKEKNTIKSDGSKPVNIFSYKNNDSLVLNPPNELQSSLLTCFDLPNKDPPDP